MVNPQAARHRDVFSVASIKAITSPEPHWTRKASGASWRSTGIAVDVPQLAPHDLRTTFAKLAHKGRAALEQIQLSLGHASIQTTERYLGVQQDLTDAPCDHLGLRLSG